MLMTRCSTDLRAAWKGVRGGRFASLAAVVALGLGIGASVSAGAIAYSGLLRPLPFANGRALVTLQKTHRPTGRLDTIRLSEFRDWHAHLEPAGELIAFSDARLTLRGGSGPTEVRVGYVAGRFFDVLGMPATAGRMIREADTTDDAVLSQAFARQLAGSAEAALGRSFSIADRTFTVVGVMPASFSVLGEDYSLWVPARTAEPVRFGASEDTRSYRPILRLAPGRTLASARDASERTLNALTPASQHGSWRIDVRPLRDHLIGNSRPVMLVFAAASGLVLLVACANVAMLLVNRSIARSREFAVRLALGASRGRLIGTAVLETMVLAVGAAALGWWIALTVTGWLETQTGLELPSVARRASAWPIAGGVLLAMACVVAICAAAPILAMGQSRLRASLRTATTTPSRTSRRLRGALVVAQLAMAIVLVAGAVLLGRTLLTLSRMDLGLTAPPSRVVTLRVPVGESSRRDPASRLALVDEMLRQARRLPGVQAAGLGGGLPPATGGVVFTIRVVSDSTDATRAFDLVPVTDGYLDALGARLVRGRLFVPADRLADPAATPLVVVSESALRHLRLNEDVVDRELSLALPTASGKRVKPRVIGVIKDIRYAGLDTPAHGGIYVMWRHLSMGRAYLAVRTSGDPAAVVHSLPGMVRAIEPTIPIADARTLGDEVERTLAPRSSRMGLVGVFAAAAVLLAVIGLAGTLVRFVTERHRELAIRAALGATPRALVGGVLRHGLGLMGAGVVGGVAASMAAGRAASSLIFGVTPYDPWTYVITVAAIGALAAAACYWPARRAAGADPVALLRGE
jgi:predicted permease